MAATPGGQRRFNAPIKSESLQATLHVPELLPHTGVEPLFVDAPAMTRAGRVKFPARPMADAPRGSSAPPSSRGGATGSPAVHPSAGSGTLARKA